MDALTAVVLVSLVASYACLCLCGPRTPSERAFDAEFDARLAHYASRAKRD